MSKTLGRIRVVLRLDGISRPVGYTGVPTTSGRSPVFGLNRSSLHTQSGKLDFGRQMPSRKAVAGLDLTDETAAVTKAFSKSCSTEAGSFPPAAQPLSSQRSHESNI